MKNLSRSLGIDIDNFDDFDDIENTENFREVKIKRTQENREEAIAKSQFRDNDRRTARLETINNKRNTDG